MDMGAKDGELKDGARGHRDDGRTRLQMGETPVKA